MKTIQHAIADDTTLEQLFKRTNYRFATTSRAKIDRHYFTQSTATDQLQEPTAAGCITKHPNSAKGRVTAIDNHLIYHIFLATNAAHKDYVARWAKTDDTTDKYERANLLHELRAANHLTPHPGYGHITYYTKRNGAYAGTAQNADRITTTTKPTQAEITNLITKLDSDYGNLWFNGKNMTEREVPPPTQYLAKTRAIQMDQNLR